MEIIDIAMKSWLVPDGIFRMAYLLYSLLYSLYLTGQLFIPLFSPNKPGPVFHCSFFGVVVHSPIFPAKNQGSTVHCANGKCQSMVSGFMLLR